MNSIRELVYDKSGLLKSGLWIEWQHEYKGFSHCRKCLALHGCWFRDDKRPKLPHHYGCHCVKKYIAPPEPHKTCSAVCAIEKFRNYVFGEKGAENGKMELFEQLGFTKDDSEYLQNEYQTQAAEKYCNGDYELNKLDENGQRINIKIALEGKLKKRSFISGWIVEPHGKIRNITPMGRKDK